MRIGMVSATAEVCVDAVTASKDKGIGAVASVVEAFGREDQSRGKAWDSGTLIEIKVSVKMWSRRRRMRVSYGSEIMEVVA